MTRSEVEEGKKLHEGMLLLDPSGPGASMRPTVYMVASKGGKVLLAAVEDIQVRMTLRKPLLPKGWQILNNRALAKHILVNADRLRANIHPGSRVENKGGGQTGVVDSIVESEDGASVMVLLDREFWETDAFYQPIPYRFNDLVLKPKES